MNAGRGHAVLDGIRAAVAAHEKELAELRRQENWWARQLDVGEVSGKKQSEAPSPPDPVPTGAGVVELTGTQGQIVERLLRERSPQTIGELVEAVLATGYRVGGDTAEEKRERLYGSLASMLRKKSRKFRRVRPGVWALIDEQVAN